MPTPLPSPEADRLAALNSYAIVDSLPETEYDELTQLAAQICQTPISLITLVDDTRQWFKSAYGLSVQQTPREGGFCTHTVNHPLEVSVIEDARLSEQFAQHPLVTGEPHIIFYAGAPLVNEHGLALGSLCVIDTQPRQLSPAQRSALSVLAKQVVNLFTLRKQNQQLRLSQQQSQREQLALAQSEARFRNLVTATPAATAVFVGREMVIEQVNAPMLAIWGKEASVLGRTLHAAMPELEDQPFLAQLQHVFDTGEPFLHREGRADMIVNGQPKRVWFNHAYNPLYDEAGQIYGVINTAIEVTQQVLARQALQENQLALSDAIALAELGTWTLEVGSGATQLSPHHATMFGLDTTQVPYETALAIVHPDDRDRVRAAFEQALRPGADGHYQAEYRIINAQSGQQQVIRARGQARFSSLGEPLHIAGTSQDVTRERALQRDLETQVQQRTQQLQVANGDLQRSNDNLQQFAYVASHDLQEPLRKIQSFSTLLGEHLGEGLDEIARLYLDRISEASGRMSVLIKDLLTYSRIATRQQAFGPISLNAVVAGVLDTLSWEIEHRQARIQLDELPIINGDHSQLGQLFQNLLSNALKFTPVGQAPQIQVTYFQRRPQELPVDVHPSRSAPFYHQISLHDEGVGFDTKYLDRIFQVFQRLHGKDQFPGTGVGLAICQRVVENHGGAITADSQPGQGATFCVYLPA